MSFPIPSVPGRVSLLTDWTAEHLPGDLPLAEKALGQMHAELGRAVTRPADFLYSMRVDAQGLPPALRPWFWDSITQALLLDGATKGRRAAPKAHAEARRAEDEHALPIDPEHRITQTLFVAGKGVLPAKEVTAFRTWAVEGLDPQRAHRAVADIIAARATGGSAPAGNTHSLLAKAAKAAGVGPEEQALALAHVLGASRGTDVPAALFTGAAKVFAQNRLPDASLAALWELFPPHNWAQNQGGPWLRLLEDSGAVDALADGRITPEGGVSGWLERFVRTHKFGKVRDGVMAQQIGEGLHELLPRLAPRLRAEGHPLDLWSSGQGNRLDTQFLGSCLELGVPVALPPSSMPFSYWGGDRMRPVYAHPVLGPRLEAQISRFHRSPGYEVRRGARSAVGFSPGVAGAVDLVRKRVDGLLDGIAGAGVPQAADDVRTLDSLLDDAAVRAFQGIEDELDGLDPVGPLVRALRTGLPEELGWSAFDAAVAELGGPDEVQRVCPSWPALTLVGRDRAIAVDHTGRLGECELLEEDGEAPVARYLDGRFLVASQVPRLSGLYEEPVRVRWSDRPGTSLSPDELDPQTADWAHEHSHVSPGERAGYRLVPAPGTIRGGAGQMSDGTGVWLTKEQVRRDGWQALTGDGVEEGCSLPAFFDGGPGEGRRWDDPHLSLVRLPEGVDSPLGHENGLSGFRISVADQRPAPDADDHVIEGADGRSATHHRWIPMGRPWAILRFPGTDTELVVTEGQGNARHEELCCYDAADGTLQWTVLTAPVSGRKWADPGLPFYPRVGFWHFLEQRDPASSHALRSVDNERARALLDAHLVDGSDGVLRALDTHLPGVDDARVRDGVVRAVAGTAELLQHRVALAARVRADRAALPEAP